MILTTTQTLQVLALENTEQSMRTAADVDTLAQKTDLKLQLEIKELTLTLLREEAKPFVISRTRGLVLTASNRKFDTSMSLSLQEFHLIESVQQSKENFIIQSPAPMIMDPSVSSAKSNQSASEHLSISISRYEPLSPKYVRAKGDVEIEFQMSHFAVTCKQSTLASLVNFLVTPMSDRSWSEQDNFHHKLRRRHSTRFRRSLSQQFSSSSSLLSSSTKAEGLEDIGETVPLHTSDGVTIHRRRQRRSQTVVASPAAPTNSHHRRSSSITRRSTRQMSMSGFAFLAGREEEDVTQRVKQELRDTNKSKRKSKKKKKRRDRNDERENMVRELRKRDLAPDHCRVHIVAKAQAVSLRMETDSTSLCIFWAQDLFTEVAIAPCLTEMRGHTGALCLKDLSPRTCCVEDRWRYIMIGRSSSSSTPKEEEDDENQFFKWSFRKSTKDSPFWDGHPVRMEMFFDAFTFTFRYRFYEEMWNFVYVDFRTYSR